MNRYKPCVLQFWFVQLIYKNYHFWHAVHVYCLDQLHSISGNHRAPHQLVWKIKRISICNSEQFNIIYSKYLICMVEIHVALWLSIKMFGIYYAVESIFRFAKTESKLKFFQLFVTFITITENRKILIMIKRILHSAVDHSSLAELRMYSVEWVVLVIEHLFVLLKTRKYSFWLV